MSARAWVVAPLLAALVLACADPGDARDATAPAVDGQAYQAPEWLLQPLAHGTWDASGEDDVETYGYAFVRGWVDARVRNRRYSKRVLLEVAAPYAGGAVMRTLHPMAFREAYGDGWERWGADSVEIFPDGGPHGARLAGPVLYRVRLQEDPDGDGRDQMIVTPWEVLYGDGEPVRIADDPWAPGLTSPVHVVGADPAPEALFTPFDDAGQRVLDQIDAVLAAHRVAPSERHTLHAAIFNINDPEVADRLIAAHRAGVEVRLVIEATKLRPWRTWQTEDDRLLAAGVPLLGVRRGGRGAMHTKLALFDGRALMTGSFNWEVGSRRENHENMVVTRDEALLRAYARRFEALAGMVAGGREHAADPNARVSVSWAPDEAPQRIVGRLIDGARERIRVAMFTAKDVEYDEDGVRTSIFAKLGAAAARGVEVEVLTDYGIAEASEYFGVWSEDDPADERLEALGVKVVRGDNPFGPYASMHHKFLVIDDAVVVTGAFNWYWDAAYLNDEDQLVWRDARLAATFTGELCDLMRRYDPDWDPAEWPAVTVHVAAHHDQTTWGDAVGLVGDLDALGGWDADAALDLEPSAWPLWRGTLSLPAGVRGEAKLVTRAASGAATWQGGGNRRFQVPATGADEATLELWW
ncbi:MAG: hypothetical protein EP329_22435 [Deltaproteobacteria bacterium]|nr:MAG: hypothetical protein EP329_22435 [Deltaproteobacteria bacterium]